MRVGSLFKAIGAITVATGVVVSPIAIAIYSIPKKEDNPRILRSVYNGRNIQNTPFNFRKTDSYGSTVAGVDNVHVNTYTSGLVRTVSKNEDIKVAVVNGDTINYEDPTGIHAYEERVQLDLAEALIYKTIDSQSTPVSVAFFNDEDFIGNKLNEDLASKYANYEHKKIGSEEFLTILNAPSKTKKEIHFVIRDEVYWSDYKGKKTEYKLIPEDFYYSLLHSGMSNNRWRNAKWDAIDNPFGGHDNIGGAYPEEGQTPNEAIQLSTNIDAHYQISKFYPNSLGYPNEYLFPLFGMTSPSQLVIENNNTSGKEIPTHPKFISSENNTKTIKFTASEESNMGSGIKKLLTDSLLFAPVPSQYIQEEYAEKDLPGITIPDGWAKRTGLYTYGSKFTDNLYVSPYTVVESNQFRARYRQNPNYWNESWLKDENTVEELLIEYSSNSDQNIFAQSNFFQFRNDKVYSIDYQSATPAIRKALDKEPNRFGVRYKAPFNDKTLVGDLLPSMSIATAPNNDLSWYYLSDAAAKMQYGSSLANISAGNHKYSDYMNEYSVRFRSLVNAAPNYYALTNYLYPDGSNETWTSFMPPDAKIKEGSTNTIYDNKETINSVYYFLKDENDNIITKQITNEENKDWYEQNSNNASKQKYSAAFDELKAEMKKLLDEAGIEATDKIKVIVPERNASPTVTQQETTKLHLAAINDLDPRLEFEYKLAPTDGNWFNDIVVSKSIHRFGGWTGDYDSVGSMITGLSSYGSFIPLAGYVDYKAKVATPNPSDIAQEVETYETSGGLFPNLVAYALHFNKWYKDEITKRVTDMSLNNSLINLVGDLEEASLLTNDVTGSLLGNQGLMLSLFDKENATSAELSDFNKLIPFISSALAQFDLHYFGTNSISSEEEMVINTINEIQLLMGNARGWFGNSIPSRTSVTPMVFRKDLLVPISKTGITYLSDWRVNTKRAEHILG